MRIRTAAFTFALVGLAVLEGQSASATPVMWQLNDVTFDDGSIATGWFTYDADTDAFSGWDILTSAGSNYLGYEYTSQDSNPGGSGSGFLFYDPNGTNGKPAVEFNLAAAMTDAGGVLQIVLNSPPVDVYTDTSVEEWFNGDSTQGRLITGGEIVGGTPEPASLFLFGSGLAFALYRRQMKWRY